jgi:mannosylglycoprotein endo-beta-mannosidase
MSARAVHQLLVAEAPAWLLEEMNKIFRGFFWAAKERANGGQCLVAWSSICRPFEFGGLGVKDLRLQSLALRVRWEWLRRIDRSRPWQGLPMQKDQQSRIVFDSLVRIKVGDGRQVLFWRDRWLHGSAVSEITPSVMHKVKTRAWNARTVRQGCLNDAWVLDVQGNLSDQEEDECMQLQLAIHSVELNNAESDVFSWPWSSSGQYTARSTYKMLVQGSTRFQLGEAIWKNRATPKSKHLVWLAVQHRIWTSERRFRHGIQTNNPPCFVCLQEVDAEEHFLLQCVVARQVWHICRHQENLDFEDPSREDTLEAWWSRERARMRRQERKDFDTLVCTVSYALWKNRNAWLFGNERRQHSPLTIAALISEEYNIVRGRQGERAAELNRDAAE